MYARFTPTQSEFPTDLRAAGSTVNPTKRSSLDATIVRRPTVCFVDELAHTNAPGSRHSKRFQDVEELPLHVYPDGGERVMKPCAERWLTQREAEALLDRAGLSAQAAQICGTLAYGDLKRLEFALATAHQPRLLLLDEISEGLAPVIVQALSRTIRKLKEKGYTIVLVEQNFRFAAPLADRFYVLERGRIVEAFAAAELAGRMPMLHEFLGV